MSATGKLGTASTMVLALALALTVGPPASAAEISEGRAAPGFAQGKPFGIWAKADGAVRGVVAEFMRHQERGEPEAFRPTNPTLQHSRGRLVVDIVAGDDPEALLAELRRFGMQDASRYDRVISGSLPIGVIARVLEIEGLQAMTAARLPLNNAGSVTSEGVEAMVADVVLGSGYDGTGVTIGVLSDSFDQQGGYDEAVTSGDLPDQVNVLDDSADCGSACSDEGRAMMELVHDVAPGADLAFHSAFVGGKAGFANGIRDLAAAGADIVVDDVIYFTEAMFQDDIIAQAADEVVAGGAAYFSSAGNFARMSYEAPYRDSGEPLTVNSEERGILHDFDAGASVDWHQGFDVPAFSTHRIITIVLQWDQPFASLSAGKRAAENDLDIYITDAADPASVLASSVDNNSTLNGGSGEPIELLQFQVGGCNFWYVLAGYGCVPEGNHRLLISLYDGAPPALLKLIMFDHSIGFEHPTHSSTVFGHANAAGAEAVGAAYWEATPPFCGTKPDETYDDCETYFDGTAAISTAQLEYFSAAGRTPILFDAVGKPIPMADAYSAPRIRKPEIVGPDGTNTTFFFSDTDRDPDSNPNFFGTSAAAPHVAAVGALMLEANPALTPAELYAALESTALNMNPRPDGYDSDGDGSDEDSDGFDFDTGWGFVQADLAVQAVGGSTGNRAPTAAFTFDCPDLSCTFDGSGSSDSDGTITSYDWDFGDGNTGTGVDPSHSYIAEGTYTVTLTVTDDGNASDETSQSVSVAGPNEPPTASFSASCIDLECTFTDTSGDSDGTILSWSWDFDGDGTEDSAVQSPTHTYGSGGTYTVTLVVTDDDDAESAAAEQDVTVTEPTNAPPTAAFEFECADLSCSFDASTSSDTDGTVVSYAWSFGGDGSASGVDPTHTFSAAGDYDVTLIVTDDGDATDSQTTGITVTAAGDPSVHVDLSGTSVNNGKTWAAEVTIAVHDTSHNGVAGILVSGDWSGGGIGSTDNSCTTGPTGQCMVTAGNIPKKEGTATFTVTSVGPSDYDSAQNHETSVTIAK